MSTATLDEQMATEKPKTLSVKLRTEVVEAARIVSAYSGDQITDLLSNILEPILAKMEQEEHAKRAKAQKR